MNKKTNNMAVTAVMTAVMCIIAPISIPVGPIPVSLATLVIFISVYILGMKHTLAAVALYLIIGLAGIPVFSGFSAGPAKLLGPTGGYLIGYIPMVVIAGSVTDRYWRKHIICAAAMAAATFVLYSIGTAWLAYSANMSAGAALAAGVLPFVPLDLIKIVISAILGPVVKIRLDKAGFSIVSAGA